MTTLKTKSNQFISHVDDPSPEEPEIDPVPETPGVEDPKGPEVDDPTPGEPEVDDPEGPEVEDPTPDEPQTDEPDEAPSGLPEEEPEDTPLGVPDDADAPPSTPGTSDKSPPDAG